MASDDLFEDLFSLEDDFHNEGYEAGYADGLAQARVEAQVFGIEQGYAKFVEMGKVQARAKLWELQLRDKHEDIIDDTVEPLPQTPSASAGRLKKHLAALLALVDPSTLLYENTDDAVADFDDRLKRALAKVKIIERLLGGGDDTRASKTGTASTGPVNAAATGRAMEDFGA